MRHSNRSCCNNCNKWNGNTLTKAPLHNGMARPSNSNIPFPPVTKRKTTPFKLFRCASVSGKMADTLSNESDTVNNGISIRQK